MALPYRGCGQPVRWMHLRQFPVRMLPVWSIPFICFRKTQLQITLVTSPLLNFMPGRDIRIVLSFNNEAPHYIINVPDNFRVHWSNPAWAETVVNQARNLPLH
ncbi:MAG: hypothetical protein HC905_27815 [Bacteroidales bacterium]|nr:hypothetical protein [Bacteroidales bacterium]